MTLLLACARGSSEDVEPVPPATTPPQVVQDSTGNGVLPDLPPPAGSNAVLLTRIDPTNILAGSAPRGLDVTLTGSGFASGAMVATGADVWRALVVNDTTIKLTIPGDRLAQPGVLRLTVLAGSPETRSNELTLTVDASTSSIRLEPSSATARTTGTGSLSLVVRGDAFDPASVVLFDGVDVPTTFHSSTELRATVPNTLLRDPGQVAVIVRRVSRLDSTQLFTVLTSGTGGTGGTGGASCGNRGRCSDTGMKKGECTGEFPAYRCGDDGCLTLVASCSGL